MMIGYQTNVQTEAASPHPVIPTTHTPTFVPPRSKAAGKKDSQGLMVITSKARPGEPETVKALMPVSAVPKKRSAPIDASWWTPDSDIDAGLTSASSSTQAHAPHVEPLLPEVVGAGSSSHGLSRELPPR